MSKLSVVKLGDLVEFQRGFDLPKTNFIKGDVPVISSNGVLGYHNLYKVKGPGITIGRSGTVGYPCYISKNFFPHNTTLFIKDFKGNDPKYIFYLLKTLKLNERKSGSGVPTMNRNHLHPLKILAFLDPDKQKQITSILSNLDSKIEINNRINSELESMAKTIYDYWFVQFDFPTSAEYASTVGKPEMTGKPYKSSGGKMVWNNELKREIPEGWKVSQLKEFALTASGGTPLSSKEEYYENGNIPWINSGELNESYIFYTNNFITKEGLDNSNAKIFSEQTLLVALYGATAGKVSLLMIPACTNQAVCAIIPNNRIFTLFLKFAISGIYKYLVNLSTGSARDNLSQDVLKELKFIIPANNLLNLFNEIIDPIVGKISINIKENQQLSSLRDWLLPMLMNGQLKLKGSSEN